MIAAGQVLAALVGLLALVMAVEGLIKLVGRDAAVEGFRAFGYPQWFRLVVGGLELVGAAALAGGVALSDGWVLAAGGVVVATVLVGAIGSHRRAGDSLAETAPAAAVLVLCLTTVPATVWLLG